MKKVIIVGATSGMGRELAILYAKKNCLVGVTGRRKNLLMELQQQFPHNIFIQAFDNIHDDIAENLFSLINQMQGLDLLVISSGAGYLNTHLEFSIEKNTIDLNVTAWTAIAGFAFSYFAAQKSGCLVAITSIAAIRAEGRAPAYGASKSYQAKYLGALRKKSFREKLNVRVTDVQPGYVKSSRTHNYHRFWEASLEKAARQIFRAIESGKKKAYITHRWWIIAQLLKILPDFIYYRL